ncbi:unnamed protein product, partial [Ixodes pacificus]
IGGRAALETGARGVREEERGGTNELDPDDSAKHRTEPAPGKTAATALNDSVDQKTEPAPGKTRSRVK